MTAAATGWPAYYARSVMVRTYVISTQACGVDTQRLVGCGKHSHSHSAADRPRRPPDKTCLAFASLWTPRFSQLIHSSMLLLSAGWMWHLWCCASGLASGPPNPAVPNPSSARICTEGEHIGPVQICCSAAGSLCQLAIKGGGAADHARIARSPASAQTM